MKGAGGSKHGFEKRNPSLLSSFLPMAPSSSSPSPRNSLLTVIERTSESVPANKSQKDSSGQSFMISRRHKEVGERISNGPNNYQIGAEIGRGGFAVVFQAFNVETGDFVAVKRFPLAAIDDDSLTSIEAEIELMQKLNHSNIVKYIDTIRTKAYLHIVLEYMENGSLANVLKRFGSFSESLISIYINQVLRGLKYLHEQGVLHRDIKGANILTTKEGIVKLADFGVSMKLSDVGTHQEDQAVVGTPYWVAPEIIEMSTPTTACDIWSVGCTIVELLTGKPPYFDMAPMAALFRIVQDNYPPLPDGISPALRDFLLQCFQKEPVMRSSAAQLLEHPWLKQPGNKPSVGLSNGESLSLSSSSSSSSSSLSLAPSRSEEVEKRKEYVDGDKAVVGTGEKWRSPSKSHHGSSSIMSPRRSEGESYSRSKDKDKDRERHKKSQRAGSAALGSPGVTKSAQPVDGSVDNRVTGAVVSPSISQCPSSSADSVEKHSAVTSFPVDVNAAGSLQSVGLVVSQLAPLRVPGERSPEASRTSAVSLALNASSSSTDATESTSASDSPAGSAPPLVPAPSIASAGTAGPSSSSVAVAMASISDDLDEEAPTPRRVVSATPSCMSLSLLEATVQRLGTGAVPISGRSSATRSLSSPVATPSLAPLSLPPLSPPPLSPPPSVGLAVSSCSSSGSLSPQETVKVTIASPAIDECRRQDCVSSIRMMVEGDEHTEVTPEASQSTIANDIVKAAAGVEKVGVEGELNIMNNDNDDNNDNDNDDDNHECSVCVKTDSGHNNNVFEGHDDEDNNNDDDDDDDSEEEEDNEENDDEEEDEEEDEEDWDAEFQVDLDDGNPISKSKLSLTREGSLSLRTDSLSPPPPPGSEVAVGGLAPKGLERRRQRIPQEYVDDIRSFLSEPTSPPETPGRVLLTTGDNRLAHRRRQMSEKLAVSGGHASPAGSGYGLPSKRGSSSSIAIASALVHASTSTTQSTESTPVPHLSHSSVGSISILLKKYQEDPSEEMLDTTLATEFEKLGGGSDSIACAPPAIAVPIRSITPMNSTSSESSAAESIAPNKPRSGGSVTSGRSSVTSAAAGKSLASELRKRMKSAVKQTDRDANFDDLLKSQMDEDDAQRNVNRDADMKRATEVSDLISKITPNTPEGDVASYCGKMLDLFNSYPQVKDVFINHFGVTPIMDMFETQTRLTNSSHNRSSGSLDWSCGASTSSAGVDRGVCRHYVLQVINKIIDGCQRAQEQLSLMGLIPAIIRLLEGGYKAPLLDRVSSSSVFSGAYSLAALASKSALHTTITSIDPAVLEAAKFIHLISSTSSLTLQMLIGAGGLAALVHMVSFSHMLPCKIDGNSITSYPAVSTSAPSSTAAMIASSSGKSGLPALADLQAPATSSKQTSFALKIETSSAVESNTCAPSPCSSVHSSCPSMSPKFAGGGSAISMPSGFPAAFEDARNMVYMGIDCVMQVFSVQSSRTRDFCRLFIKLGLLRHLSQAFAHLMIAYRSRNSYLAPSIEASAHSGCGSNKESDATSVCSEVSSGGKHLRRISDGTEFSYVSNSEILALLNDPDCTIECRYAYCIASIFLKFSRSDNVVSEQMAHEPGVLSAIITSLQAPELRGLNPSPHGISSGQVSANASYHGPPPGQGVLLSRTNSGVRMGTGLRKSFRSTLGGAYVTIVEVLLRCLKNLSMEPSALSDLDDAGTISTLIPLLSGPISDRCKNHVMPCIFNLCRINKRRQEQAAVNGIIPHLQALITNESHLKQFALPIICDLAHTSSTARIELWKNGGVAFYINLLRENYWQTFALNSLATWLTNDAEYVQGLLIQPVHLSRLVDFFRSASTQTIRTLHKPLLDMMSKSNELTRALCSSGLYVTALIRRLQNSEALVLRSLLKMLQLLHQYHPSPRQFVLDYDLYTVVRGLAQAEAQVLVHQMANRLLMDFQHSTMT